eukprot:243669-Rhodomonas_salina.1
MITGKIEGASNLNLSAWSFGSLTTRPQYYSVSLATAPNQMRHIYESVPTSGETGDARCTGVPCPAELPRYF